MTRTQVYVAGGALVALWLLWPRKAAAATAATGDVTAGTPTVHGSGSEQLGDEGYYSNRPVIQPDQQLLVGGDIKALTNEAADRLAAFNADHPESEGGDFGRVE